MLLDEMHKKHVKEKNVSHAILQFVLQDEVYHSSFVKLQRGKTLLYSVKQT